MGVVTGSLPFLFSKLKAIIHVVGAGSLVTPGVGFGSLDGKLLLLSAETASKVSCLSL